MRVLVVANMFPSERFPTYGIFVRNFCDQLDSIGIDYSLAVAHKQIKKTKKITEYIKFYSVTFIKSIFGRYEYIYIHYPSYSARPVLIAKWIKKIHLIINVHGSDVLPITESQKRQEKNTRAAIFEAEKVIVPSQYFREVVNTKYMCPDQKIFVYPSGGVNNTVFFPYDKNRIIKLKLQNNIDPNKFTVGFISRIYRAKGWDTFVEAVSKLKDYESKMQFIMVGSGPEEDELDELIRVRGLENSIKRYPSQPQSKLADYYNLLDVFVFPTASAESLGLVAIEAMSCSIPVIASDIGAPRYYIENDKNGFKFDVGDSIQLAGIISGFFNYSAKKIMSIKKDALETAESYSTENSEKILRIIMR